MAIDKELEAMILRFHHVEKWKVDTIFQQLGVHHKTVDRVLSQAGIPRVERTCHPSNIDTYLPFIIETLNRYPSLTDSRLPHLQRSTSSRRGSECLQNGVKLHLSFSDYLLFAFYHFLNPFSIMDGSRRNL